MARSSRIGGVEAPGMFDISASFSSFITFSARCLFYLSVILTSNDLRFGSAPSIGLLVCANLIDIVGRAEIPHDATDGCGICEAQPVSTTAVPRAATPHWEAGNNLIAMVVPIGCYLQ